MKILLIVTDDIAVTDAVVVAVNVVKYVPEGFVEGAGY